MKDLSFALKSRNFIDGLLWLKSTHISLLVIIDIIWISIAYPMRMEHNNFRMLRRLIFLWNNRNRLDRLNWIKEIMYMYKEQCFFFIFMTNEIDHLIHDLNLFYLINFQINKFDLYHIIDMIFGRLIPSNFFWDQIYLWSWLNPCFIFGW